MQQPMSLLSLESPVQGVLDAPSRFHNRQIGYTALLNHQAFDQEKYLKQPLPFSAFEENQPLMDELLEQLLSCSEFGGLSKVLLNQGSGISAPNLGEVSLVSHPDIPSTGTRDGLLSPVVETQLSQPYGCSVPNFQMVPANLQMEPTSYQIHQLGKRRHDPGLSIDESSLPSPGLEKLFHFAAVELPGISQIVTTTNQLNAQDITVASQDISNQSHGSEVGLHQPHSKVQDGITAEPSRPRVRARRGQATDPHSIAERLRRERIAERMRSLQELVPNSNKTDKASMLDEIIEYVKFLQLQVKVLSISRLGVARAVTPSVAGLHYEGVNETGNTNSVRSGGHVYSLEDGVSLTEQHIAQLMEEDIGIAMQNLQARGLCLMPIALAHTISGKGNQHGIEALDVSDKGVNTKVYLTVKKELCALECINAASDGALISYSREAPEVKSKEETYLC
ncbi:hypothetical protein O6H91_18G040500 [Diphasiastrum complanatum]|uniref:Uncharacterized protein n=2 Tax=Diphasiastrum complanatum TaxID=34168 RepID=A0ACC2B067_DIPCM|nr:hypothetical protein O6H91_18G040500 [Diphasiastrum complanatum]KAJ7523178.1 hypothetical protein O6H91_18G040500 [Diphasiastrum complanatum]